MMSKSAIIYCRVSTDDQQDNNSLPSQERLCREYAAKNGYTVIDIFKDAFTGTTLDRPGLNEVSRRAGTFDVLLVHSSDRLSRETVDLLVFNQRLNEAGTSIEFLLNPVDGSTNIGEVMLALQGYAAKEWRRGIIEASKRGKREKVRSGKVSLGALPPYGYDKGEDSMLVINEVQAAVIRQMFEWYVYGDETGRKLGSRAIADRLTELGIPTAFDNAGMKKARRKAGVWCGSSIVKMLSNEVYIGRWFYGSYRNCEHRAKGQTLTPIEVAVPPIIDKELFQLAREQANRNYTYAQRNTKRTYMLRGRCKCAKCGYSIQGNTIAKDGYTYYRCLHTGQRGAVCKGGITAKVLEGVVWSAISEALESPESILQAIRFQSEQLEKKNETLLSYLDTHKQQLAELEQYRRDLVDNFLRRRIPEDIYEEKLVESERKIADYRAKIAEYSCVLDQRVKLPSEADIISICDTLAGRIDNATLEEKMEVLELLNVRCLVDRDNNMVTITGFLPVVMNRTLTSLVNNSKIPFSIVRRIA